MQVMTRVIITGLPLTMKYLQLIKSKDGKHRFELIQRTSTKWREIGVLINIESNMLDEYWKESQSTATRCWEKVMQAWMNGQGQEDYPITWEGLYSILTDVHSANIAQDLRKAVESA